MQEVIQIIEKEDKNLVSARDLYNFLEVKTDFTDWCKRMFKYGFEEHLDYTLLKIGEGNAHNKNDYALTLDCAKEISMLQRTEKGKQARLYFIECEKRFNKAKELVEVKLPTPLETARMLVEALEKNEYNTKLIEELQPKADYTDKVLRSKSDCTITVIAKELGMSAAKLNKLLKEKGVQYQVDGTWVLYSKYDKLGYTETRTYVYTDYNEDQLTKKYTVWTEKGRAFIHSLFNNKLKK